MLGLAAALLIICLISSTPEGRAEAGKIIDPIARKLVIPTLILWVLILWPVGERLLE